ncbi:hypothetical protein JQ596_05755 [Bradyrhizobium manausense]|uniref:hypothetical protein n=1 Tax=Bradyrhizobium TaxID=374 RepID=UPI001BA44DC6|nr:MULTISPECIES: hypothetical protein [Bradyrhizobium]MBR0825031.1 hypothetical protein [Bradyrhizobium manausense]UVO29208.1 hypothetical protein KUF59_00020 [Bradyrhizobium arachidis]
MTTVRPGATVPARWRPFACGLAFLAVCLVTATSGEWMPHLSQLFSPALTADPKAELPAPTQYSFRGFYTTVTFGVETPLRRELDARLPARLGDVLVFYRTELAKLGWQEQGNGADVRADHVQLAFASPVGPALLKLGRKDNSTTVSLVQKNESVATRANLLPEPGQAKLVFSNISDQEAALTINAQTITRAADAHGVALDLPPGKYAYELNVPGHPATTNVLTVAAGDTWEVSVGRDGGVWSPQHLY